MSRQLICRAVWRMTMIMFAMGVPILAGCASQAARLPAGKPASVALLKPAVRCSGCKIIWIKSANQNRSVRALVYTRRSPAMACPDCKSALFNFFKTGKLRHTCAACHGVMTICKEFWP